MEKNRINKMKIKKWFKDPYNLALVGILVFAFCLRLYYFILTKNQPLWWDEAEYMLKAKHFAFGTPDTGWFSLRPLLLPLVGAVFFKIGIGELGIRISWLFISVANVFLIFLLGKELFNKKIGLLASFLYVPFYLDMFYANRILVDLPQIFFILLGALFLVKYCLSEQENKKFGYFIFPVLFLGALMRFTVGVFIITVAIFFILFYRLKILKKKELIISGVIGIFLFCPYLIYAWISYGNPFHAFVGAFTAERSPKDTPIHVFMSYIKYFPHYTDWILTIIFLVGLIFILYNIFVRLGTKFTKNIQKFTFLILWILIPMIYFGFFVNHFEDRYIFMIFPSVFLIIAFSLDLIMKNLKKHNKALSLIFIILILCIGFYHMFTYSNFIIKAKLNTYNDLKNVGIWIKDHSNPNDIILAAGIPQITYYSERATYSHAKTLEQELQKIKNKKIKYLVVSNWERSPDWIYELLQKNQTYFTSAYISKTNHNGFQSFAIVLSPNF